MKYEKGTFIVLPNINILDTLDVTSQALFIWLCKYADDEGICFPSRSKLARHINRDVKTIDRHIALLEEKGFITKTKRGKIGTKENLSNLYQIQLLSLHPVPPMPLPSDTSVPTPSPTSVAVTIPNSNYTHLTIIEPTAKVEEELPLQSVGNLPSSFGKTYIMRLHYIYRYLWSKKYGVKLTTSNIGMFGKVMKSLISTHTEKQIAILLLTYFNWYGGSGDNEKENKYLSDKGFPVTLLPSKIDILVAYLTNNIGVCYDKQEDVDKYFIRSFKDILNVS